MRRFGARHASGKWMISILGTLLCANACTRSKWEEGSIDLGAAAKIGQVVGPRTEVELAPGANFSEFVNMALFDGFVPGMRIEDAVAKYGVPSATRIDEAETPWYEYERPNARIRIGIEKAGSAEGSAGVIGWRLYVYPKDSAVDATFRGALAKHLKTRKGWHEVIIMRRDPDQAVSCRLVGDRVERVAWYDNSATPS